MSADKYSTNGVADTFVFLPAAKCLVKPCYLLRLTPNEVTGISLLFGVASLFCFVFDSYLASAVTFLIYYLLDCVDGLLARTYRMSSDGGEVYDYLKDVFLLFCFGGYFLWLHPQWYMAITLLFLAVVLFAWEGTMDAFSCYQKAGHFNFVKAKQAQLAGRNGFFDLYLVLMRLCSFLRLGRPTWYGTGEFVVAVAVTLCCNQPFLIVVFASLIFGHYLWSRFGLHSLVK